MTAHDALLRLLQKGDVRGSLSLAVLLKEVAAEKQDFCKASGYRDLQKILEKTKRIKGRSKKKSGTCCGYADPTHEFCFDDPITLYYPIKGLNAYEY